MITLSHKSKLLVLFGAICVIALSLALVWVRASDPSRMDTIELLTAAAEAYGAGTMEDAGFFFFAGKLRFRIDMAVFPPVGQGGNSPDTLVSAMSATMGPTILPVVVNDPEMFSRIVDRLSQWNPQLGPGYDPGWEYQNPLGEKAAAAVVVASRNKMLKPLLEQARLHENEEYASLSLEVNAANAVERRFWETVNNHGNVEAVPDELKAAFEEAQEKRTEAAKRMSEIEWQTNPESRWHRRVGWNAEDYFDDELVIALCHAIEADNLDEMNRLIQEGANPGAVGKDGMTPLLWAFPERKLQRFKLLLEHGADPNVYFESNFGIDPSIAFHPYLRGGHAPGSRGCRPGQSVTHLAARSPMIEYLQLVMSHGGDANLIDKETGEAPLDIVMHRLLHDSKERVKILISKNADPNRYCEYQAAYPAMQAVNADDFDTALYLLEHGANPKLYQPDRLRKLIHFVLRTEHKKQHFDAERAAEFESLVAWLEKHGESLDMAQQDEVQWEKELEKGSNLKAKAAIRKKIIAERKAEKKEE